MTDKTTQFQLDPNNFKTGNMLIDGQIKGLVKKANTVDVNHNGIPDVAELALIGAKFVTVFSVINEAVDFEALAQEAAKLPGVKDKALFAEGIKELGKLAEQVGNFIPKQAGE